MQKSLKKILSIVLVIALCLAVSPVAFAQDSSDVIIVRGDVNGDSTVNSSDALAVLRYAVGYDVDLYHYWADLTGDDKINSTDALRILQIAVGSDEPARYSDKEVLKFYADALSTSCQAAKKITYTNEYSSKLSNADDKTDFVEYYDSYDLELFYENGIDQDGDSIYDFCPSPLIPSDTVSRIYITEDNGYYVSVDLKGEKADYENPIPENTWVYAANYADCTVCGFEDVGYEVYDATALFPMTKISADISWDGYIKTLYVEIPFELRMSICDPDGYHFVDAVEKGTITDVYYFEY